MALEMIKNKETKTKNGKKKTVKTKKAA